MIRFSIARLLCAGFFLSCVSYASEQSLVKKLSIRIDNIDVFARTKLFKQVVLMQQEYQLVINKPVNEPSNDRAKYKGIVDIRFKQHNAKKADLRGQLITNGAGVLFGATCLSVLCPTAIPFFTTSVALKCLTCACVYGIARNRISTRVGNFLSAVRNYNDMNIVKNGYLPKIDNSDFAKNSLYFKACLRHLLVPAAITLGIGLLCYVNKNTWPTKIRFV